MPLFRYAVAALATLLCSAQAVHADHATNSSGSAPEFDAQPQYGDDLEAAGAAQRMRVPEAMATAQRLAMVDYSEYPDRWCLERSPTFQRRLNTIAQQSNSRGSYHPMNGLPPGRSSIAMTLSARADIESNDDLSLAATQKNQSLFGWIRSIDSHRLATLWRGKKRALFVGLQSGRYFGVSLERKEAGSDITDADRSPPRPYSSP